MKMILQGRAAISNPPNYFKNYRFKQMQMITNCIVMVVIISNSKIIQLNYCKFRENGDKYLLRVRSYYK